MSMIAHDSGGRIMRTVIKLKGLMRASDFWNLRSLHPSRFRRANGGQAIARALDIMP